MKDEKIAYLGMGIMGAAMAANLLKGGYKVRVWNRSPRPALAELATAGATVIEGSAQDCIAGSQFVFTCLGDERDVESVLSEALSAGAFEASLQAGIRPIVVDFSTIGPAAAAKIASRLAAGGVTFLDAPVTGGDIGAKNATLTIMIGGDGEAYQQVAPLLACLGKTLVHCGKSGSGQALKLCNQILCAVNMIAVTETLDYARKLGVREELIVDVLGSGAGGSWALANLGPRILSEDFAPGFSLRNVIKDLRLVFDNLPQNAAPDCLPGTELAKELFERVAAQKPANPDSLGTQAMIKAYETV